MFLYPYKEMWLLNNLFLWISNLDISFLGFSLVISFLNNPFAVFSLDDLVADTNHFQSTLEILFHFSHSKGC